MLFSATALRAVIIACGLALSGAVAAVELKLSVETPPGHARNMAAEKWGAAIARLTNNEVTVAVFPSGQLYDSAGAVRALASGALDMSVQASPTLSQFEPNLSVITLPMFFGATREQVRDILDGPLGDELYAMVATKGIVIPEGGHFEFAPNNTAYTVNKQINSFADLSGVKLATPPSPVVVAMLKAMGANPIATPRTEIVLQLTQGQIDGMGSVTDLTISGGQLWDAGIKYAFEDNAGWGVYFPLVSKAALDKLSPAHQQALSAAWSEVVGEMRQYTADELAAAKQANIDNGVTYTAPADADLAEIRSRLLSEQGGIVESSRMNADFVSRVQARLGELQG